MADFIEKLNNVFAENSLENLLDKANSKQLALLTDMLIEKCKVMNLTAIKTENGIILLHLADSATIIKHIPDNSTLLDIGCGAGFPSLPVAILRPDVEVSCMDSTAKKLTFIDECADELYLDNIKTVSGRAEELAKTQLREGYDVVTARAVTDLPALCELCMGYVSVGGIFIAMKGSSAKEELSRAEEAAKKMGCRLETKEKIILKGNGEENIRYLLIYRKTKATPETLPRNWGQIRKKPL